MKIEKSIEIYDDNNIFSNINEEGIFTGNSDNKYTKLDSSKDIEGKIINRAIIHMSPMHDTTSEEGSLYGYCDALFFKIVIYNTDTMEYYSLNNRDAVNIEVPTETRIFKDLSTMIICRKPCKISLGQAVFVYSA